MSASLCRLRGASHTVDPGGGGACGGGPGDGQLAHLQTAVPWQHALVSHHLRSPRGQRARATVEQDRGRRRGPALRHICTGQWHDYQARFIYAGM